MEIYLKRITLRNHKGIGEKSIEFSSRETTIVGQNGTGKTSLFDSFVWVLFGKDHKGRSDHQLIALDASGNPKERVDCEVEILLIVDGNEVKLRRMYGQNWVRPKGSSEDVMKGHSTSYYINDVPCKKLEYDMEVAGICNEEVFRAITNPAYFPSLIKDDQRKILFKMIGDISDEKIAGKNKDFLELLELVSGKSFEVFKSEISTKKRKIKDDVDYIPTRIDELKKTVPEPKDWDGISNRITEVQAEVSSIDSQLQDASKASESENQKKLDIQEEINEIERSNQCLKNASQTKRDSDIEGFKSQIRKLHVDVGNKNRDYETNKNRLEYLESEKKRHEEKLDALGQEWMTISAEVLKFNDDEFVCPTCKRPLEVDEVESRQNELTESFNKRKSERLSANEREGESISELKQNIEKEIASIGKIKSADVSGLNEQIKKLEASVTELNDQPLDYQKDVEYSANLQKIEELKKRLEDPAAEIKPDAELKEKKAALASELSQLNTDLGQKGIIDNAVKRINELNEQYNTMNQELAELERREFLVKEFEFAKNSEYESCINNMFHFVKFKLFHTQVDGQIVPTCECMVEGVPYSTLNNAAQVAAGLDIIDTMSRYEKVYAPIWLDNRESVTTIPEIRAQVINLVVNPSEPVLRVL